jgi:hypothetical protein
MGFKDAFRDFPLYITNCRSDWQSDLRRDTTCTAEDKMMCGTSHNQAVYYREGA